MGKFSWVTQVAPGNYKGSYDREVGGSEWERCKNEREVREEGRCYAIGAEDGGGDCEPRSVGSLRRLDQGRKGILP